MKNILLRSAYSVVLAVIAVLLTGRLAVAATDTAATVNTGATDLTSGTSFSTSPTEPTTTNDVEFTNSTYANTTFTLNTSESFGTLNDLDATQALTINNTGSGASTLTLSTQGNVVAPTGTPAGAVGDILYVGSGAGLSLGASGSTLNIYSRPGIVGARFDVNGTLEVGAEADLDVNSNNLTLDGTGSTTIDGVVTGAGTFIASAGTLTLNNGSNSALFSIQSGTTGVVIAGASGSLGTGSVGFSSGTLESGADNVVLGNAFSLGGNMAVGGTHNLALNGTIGQQSSHNLTDNDTGTLKLGGANSYTGVTTVNGGTLSVATVANGGVVIATTIGTTSGSQTATVSDTSVFTLGEAISETSGTAKAIPAGTTITGINVANNTITLSAPAGATGSSSVQVGMGNGLGISTNAASNLILSNGATFQYTGAAASTDRLFQVTATTAGTATTLDASGTGAINFTNTGAITFTGTANQARTLVLTGSNTGANTLNPLVGNNGNSAGATSVSKTGAGKWVLANNNTYTGGTTVSAGTLLVTNTPSAGVGSGTGAGALSVAAGAGFGGTGQATTTTFTIGGTGAGSTLQVGDGVHATGGLSLTGGAGSTITNTTMEFDFDTATALANILNVSSTPVAFSSDTVAITLLGTTPLANGTDVELIAGDAAHGNSAVLLADLTGLTLDFTNSSEYDGSTLVYNATRNSIDLDVSTAPEPRAWTLLLAGCGLLVLFRRTRRI